MILLLIFGFQYNRIYSPVTFGKKYDPNGDYIRHFLPVLKGKQRVCLETILRTVIVFLSL